MVLNVSKREIIFITPQLLAFLGTATFISNPTQSLTIVPTGLPFATMEDKFSSRLLHTDLLDVITGDDKAHQKALRQSVKDIVKSGKPGSMVMAFKVFNKQNLTFGLKSAKLSRAGILHVRVSWKSTLTPPLTYLCSALQLTPLKERGNKVVAYVALFGESRMQPVRSGQTLNV